MNWPTRFRDLFSIAWFALRQPMPEKRDRLADMLAAHLARALAERDAAREELRAIRDNYERLYAQLTRKDAASCSN